VPKVPLADFRFCSNSVNWDKHPPRRLLAQSRPLLHCKISAQNGTLYSASPAMSGPVLGEAPTLGLPWNQFAAYVV